MMIEMSTITYSKRSTALSPASEVGSIGRFPGEHEVRAAGGDRQQIGAPPGAPVAAFEALIPPLYLPDGHA
jgi:hypothetical protein